MEKNNLKMDYAEMEKVIEAEFRKYLRQKGKKPAVVNRNIYALNVFIDFLSKTTGKDLDCAINADIDVFVKEIEKKKQSAKGYLYVLMNYFSFLRNQNLYNHARNLREKRTKKTRRVFPLRDFLMVNQNHVEKIASIGIKNVEQMLEKGKMKIQRKKLSEQLNIPEEAILELVKLSDITRIGYVKRKLARLYYDAGLDSPAKISKFKPEQLQEFFSKFVRESGWDGMIPNLKDLESNIKNAKKLARIVEE